MGDPPTHTSSLTGAIRRLAGGQVVVLWIAVLLVAFWLNGVRHSAAEYLRVGFAFDGMIQSNATPAQVIQQRQRVEAKQRDAEGRVSLAKAGIAILLGGALAVTWSWFGRKQSTPRAPTGAT